MLKREQGVPDQDGGRYRWSLDHLFVDQDGVPTLVEVKRSKDTRIRREVVGQMLDYAANGVAYWPVADLRAAFEAKTPDADAAIKAALGESLTADDLWKAVDQNLGAGRLRMIFLADEIPSELKAHR